MSYWIWRNRVHKFLDNPKALIPFLKKKLYYNFVSDRYLPEYKTFRCLSPQETLDVLVSKRKSIIRFGDELFDMLQGIGLYYGDWHQKYDKALAERMRTIILSRRDDLMIGFNPDFLYDADEARRRGIGHQFWTATRVFLRNYFSPEMVYGHSMVFTLSVHKDLDFQKIKDFFADKHIIVITTNTARFHNTQLGMTTDFVECPKNDSWSQYDDILERARQCVVEHGYKHDAVLFLISLASPGKVLAYDLVTEGYRVWDTGQFFDTAATAIKSLLEAQKM